MRPSLNHRSSAFHALPETYVVAPTRPHRDAPGGCRRDVWHHWRRLLSGAPRVWREWRYRVVEELHKRGVEADIGRRHWTHFVVWSQEGKNIRL